MILTVKGFAEKYAAELKPDNKLDAPELGGPGSDVKWEYTSAVMWLVFVISGALAVSSVIAINIGMLDGKWDKVTTGVALLLIAVYVLFTAANEKARLDGVINLLRSDLAPSTRLEIIQELSKGDARGGILRLIEFLLGGSK